MLEPVHVGGVTVSTATLHNEEDLARKDVREGDEVVVTRAGDVIPQVISPLIQRRKGKAAAEGRSRPAKCPMCGTPTVKPEDSVWTICPNRRGCPGQTFQLVKHFRGAMDIEGLGEKNAMRFLDEGLITRPGRHLRPHRRADRRARGLRRDLGRQPDPRDRALEGAAVRDRALRARAARDRLRQRPGARASTSARSTRCSRPTPRQIKRGGGHRPGPRRAAPRGALRRGDARADRAACASGAFASSSPRPSAAPRAARWRARRSCSPEPCRT